jgi:flavin reductase (DIM6/NTAB) family NADH-FMN oxidoreductase RutF
MEVENVALSLSYRLIGHGPTVLVSTVDEAGVPNACAVAWVAPASKSPARFVLRIGEGHKTYANLMAKRVCVINVPTVDQIEEVMICGRRSGKSGDKLTPAGIETAPAAAVDAPRLTCCAAWLDCELIGTLELSGSNLVLVEAKAVACRPGVMTSDGHMDVERFPTLHHLGGDRFSVAGGVRDHASK